MYIYIYMQNEYSVFIYVEIYTQTHVTMKETEATI